MGILTNIQRFSLNDGPGIRSTVFFKGCNLRCRWCHNPETLSTRPQLLRYGQKCIGCGACVTACPTGSRSLSPEGLRYEEKTCTACGACADVCFSGALELCGREYSVDEVLGEVLQDKPYYEHSGGGVTLSGGEVLMQPAFACQLLRALKERGVSTAIETNFSFPFEEVIGPLLPWTDLWMVDIKLFDALAHKRWTGGDNARILENLRRLAALGKPVIVRTPVIPGVNDAEAEIVPIAAFLKEIGSLQYYELLNFNPLGASKYDSLEMNNDFRDARPLPKERIEALADAARALGLQVKVG